MVAKKVSEKAKPVEKKVVEKLVKPAEKKVVEKAKPVEKKPKRSTSHAKEETKK